MEKKVHVLWHVREDDPYKEDAKLIGVYENETETRAAIERSIALPGFRDHPSGFELMSMN